MIKVLTILLQFIFLSALAQSGPRSMELDENDPTRPENVLQEYSLPEQHENQRNKESLQKEEIQENDEVEKEEDIDHTQERL